MVLDDIGAYYISVDENSGLMSVRNELTRDDALSYTVSSNSFNARYVHLLHSSPNS